MGKERKADIGDFTFFENELPMICKAALELGASRVYHELCRQDDNFKQNTVEALIAKSKEESNQPQVQYQEVANG